MKWLGKLLDDFYAEGGSPGLVLVGAAVVGLLIGLLVKAIF